MENLDAYNRKNKMLQLREELLAVEEDRLHGSQGHAIQEVADMMYNAIAEVTDSNTEA